MTQQRTQNAECRMPNAELPPDHSAFGIWHSALAHLGIVVAAFVAMLIWTWRTWPDPIVDFGRELYVPWQITQGKVLYRDIAYFNGPLSPYFNAMVLKLLGVSLRSIVIANLSWLMLLIALVWRIVAIVADQLSATVASIVLICVFGFIQLQGVGNYNFITPYSHEITHGMILSIASILLLIRHLQTQRAIHLWFSGLLLGLVFLTKPEVFLASALAVVVGVVISIRRFRTPAAKSLGGLAVGLLAPPVVATLLLMTKLPISDAVRGVLGAWIYLGDTRITTMPFYRKAMGTLDPGSSAIAIIGSLVCYALWIGIAIILAGNSTRRTTKNGWMIGAGAAAALLVVFLLVGDLSVWQNALRGLSILTPALAVGALVRAWERDSDRVAQPRAVVCVFAAALLAKMLFNVVPYHYGFALAMPATLVVIAAALNWLPCCLEQRLGGWRAGMTAMMLPLVGLFVLVHLYIYGTLFAHKTTVIAPNTADMFYADPTGNPADVRGRSVQLILDRLHELPDATLACVPEGVMINYLSRRANPTPYINLMPPEVLMFGQSRIVAAFEANPPDYVVVVTRSDPLDYGYKSLSADYGVDIAAWIRTNYQQIPAPTDDRYPLVLLKHVTK